MSRKRRLPEEAHRIPHRLIVQALHGGPLHAALPLHLFRRKDGTTHHVQQQVKTAGEVARKDPDREAKVVIVEDSLQRAAEGLHLGGEPQRVALPCPFGHGGQR